MKYFTAKRKALCLLAACSMLFSCKVEPARAEDDTLVLSASICDDSQQFGSKVSVAVTGKVTWSAGDRIAVYNTGGERYPLTLVDGAGSPNGRFSGSFSGTPYLAVYPYEYSSESAGQVVLPDAVEYVGTPSSAPVLMAAKINGAGALVFKAMAGMMELNMYNIPDIATGLKVSSATKGIHGKFCFETAAPSAISARSGSSKLVYSFAGGMGVGKLSTFYLPLPLADYKDLTLCFTDADGKGIEGIDKIVIPSSSVAVAKYIAMPSLDLGSMMTRDTRKYIVGKPLPEWREGDLDIHLINAARGECIFYILPDGTTMLVDAGEAVIDKIKDKASKTLAAYQIYADYIRHYLPLGHTNLDYMMITHFHIDHMGNVSLYPKGEGGYVHVGVMGLYDLVKFNKLIDRGYPNYGDDSSIVAPESSSFPNYHTFVKKLEDGKEVALERFDVGSSTQISLLYKPSKYDCTVTNIIGNGRFMTKDAYGKTTIDRVENPGEGNPNSCGFHLRYGKFDYIASGDLTSAPQNRMVTGYYNNWISTLEVFKGHHHLHSNSWGSGMQSAGFMAQAVVACTTGVPDNVIVKRILDAGKSVFVTNLTQARIAEYPDVFNGVTGYNGHVVVRVCNGGGRFYVYMLDDTDYQWKIKSVNGPYTSLQ